MAATSLSGAFPSSADARGTAAGRADRLPAFDPDSIICCLLVDLLSPGRLVWWSVFLYVVAANAFFLVRPKFARGAQAP